MAVPSVTYTFVNGQTSDGPELNTNFTDIVNHLSDGTADLTVGSIIVNNASTFNGDVTLGNAGSDEIIINGTISSMAVSGPIDLTGSFAVSGAVDLTGPVSIVGTSTIAGPFTVKGDGSIAGFNVSASNVIGIGDGADAISITAAGAVTIGVSGETLTHIINGRNVNMSSASAGTSSQIALTTTSSTSQSDARFVLQTTANDSHAYLVMITNQGGSRYFSIGADETNSLGALRGSTSTSAFGSQVDALTWTAGGLLTMGPSGSTDTHVINGALDVIPGSTFSAKTNIGIGAAKVAASSGCSFQMSGAGDGSNTSSSFFLTSIAPSADTGSNPVLVFDARQNDNTVITTRPLFQWRNNAGAGFLGQIDVSGSWQIGPASGTVAHTINGQLDLFQQSTPSAPSSNFSRVYAKSDDNLYLLTSGGIEKQVGSGANAWTLADNDAASDGSVIIFGGDRWINGTVYSVSADITSATAATGSDDTLTTLDASNGLIKAAGATIRNHVYYDTIDAEFKTISNAADNAKWAYNSTDSDFDINLTRYIPVCYVDVVANGGGDVTGLTIENYPVQAWWPYTNVQVADGWRDWTPSLAGSGSMTVTATSTLARYRRVGNAVQVMVALTVTTGGTASTDIEISNLPIGNEASASFAAAVRDAGSGAAVSGVAFFTSSGSDTITVRKADASNWSLGTSRLVYVSGTYEIAVSSGYNAIVTPATEFDWRTAALTLKTGSALTSSDAIGTFTVYEATGTGIGISQSSTLTQTVSDIKANGFHIYAKGSGSASTSGQPNVVSIRVGKISSHQVNGYLSTGLDQPCSLDLAIDSTDARQRGLRVVYDDSQGILTLSSQPGSSSQTTANFLDFDPGAGSGATSAYVTVKASATTPVVGLPIQPYVRAEVTASTANSSFANTTFEVIDYDSVSEDNFGGVTTGASWAYVVPESGKYLICVSSEVQAIASSSLGNSGKTALFIGGAEEINLCQHLAQTTSSSAKAWQGSAIVSLTKGQSVDIRMRTAFGSASTIETGDNNNYVTIQRISNG